MERREFGSIRQLPSGRFQARYTGSDGRTYKAPRPFARLRATPKERKQGIFGAEDWLNKVHIEILSGKWIPPDAKPSQDAANVRTLGAYVDVWLRERTLKQRTRDHYKWLIETYIRPVLGDRDIAQLRPEHIRGWDAQTAPDKPTARAHAYSLLRTILGDAVRDELITRNPCQIRGAGQTKRARDIDVLDLDVLAALVEKMPARYRVMVLLAAWCGFRFGELAELRRKDVNVSKGTIRVERAVVQVRTGNVREIGPPKSDAGTRTVVVPPHLMPAVEDHLREHVAAGRESLLWPAADGTSNLAPSTFYKHFYPARTAAGVPKLRFHDLRHVSSVLAAATGATQAELMQRLGHSTPAAAQRYQHAAKDADRRIAEALSRLATGDTD